MTRRETFSGLMVELDGLLSKALEEPFILTFRTVIHTTSDDTQALLTSPLYRFERYVESQCTRDALAGRIESDVLCVCFCCMNARGVV